MVTSFFLNLHLHIMAPNLTVFKYIPHNLSIVQITQGEEMFEKLGHAVVRRRKSVLALFIVALIGLGSLAGLAVPRLSGGGYSNPNSDSAKAVNYLINTFKVRDPAVILEVRSQTSIDDPAVIATATELEKSVSSEKGVLRTLSYWSAGGAPTLASKDHKAAYLFVYSPENDIQNTKPLGKLMASKYDGNYKDLRIYVNGFAAFNSALSDKISKDLAVAEGISVPLIFLLLIFVFGGLIASATPLIVGVSAIIGALAIIYLVSLATGVSIFALNLITGMGLGLGIDYALLMVNRFREEIHHGKDVESAIVNTVKTAGKTVFYSGITVIITLAALTFFPLMFLKSFGYAGMAVVATAILAALIPFPAILALIGTRIDKFVVRKSAITPKADGRWAQTARFVMRRPIAVVLVSLIALATIASPIRNIVFSQADARVMPASSPLAIANAKAIEDFPGQEGNPIEFIIPNAVGIDSALAAYEAKIAVLPGIVRVGPEQRVGNSVRFSAVHSMNPRTNEAESLIKKARAIPAPKGTLIGGVAADYTDTQDGIGKTLPWAFGWIALGVLILLFLFTGSIILPIKAVILNVISLAAMMGALTWIFIDGHMTWLVGSFTNTHTIDTSMVILISVVTFGLSMDYEVFLLSRIKEEHESGLGNEDAVATGLQRSARIITAAALLLAIAFAAFITSGVTNIKTLGFGVAFAVILDATVVRGLLVPALMRLFGERNWWAPRWMKRFSISH
jgi:RND superfamily putative drug exporter